MKPQTRTHPSTLADLKLQRVVLVGYLNKVQEYSTLDHQKHLDQEGETLEMLRAELVLLESAIDALTQLADFQQGKGLVFEAVLKGEL